MIEGLPHVVVAVATQFAIWVCLNDPREGFDGPFKICRKVAFHALSVVCLSPLDNSGHRGRDRAGVSTSGCLRRRSSLLALLDPIENLKINLWFLLHAFGNQGWKGNMSALPESE